MSGYVLHIFSLFSLTDLIGPPVSSDANGPTCPWLCSPDGPSTPFATLYLGFADSARSLCLLLGLITILYMPSVIAVSRTIGRRMRFYALAMFILVAVTTEVVHFGDYPSYRLALNLIGCLCATHGVRSYLQEMKDDAA